MKKMTVEIVNPTGLHARPASDFVKRAIAFKSDVFLENGIKRMNAKSILGILAMGLSQGSQVDIITDGEDEEEALEALISYITNLKD
ncbi:MAG: crh [Clostridia bacterium]|jgi:phosphocarrier protein|nr:crh [Clostridia bacterium]